MPTKKDNSARAPSRQSGITRREALKTAAAVGATAALASSLPIKSVLAATPKRGGHFKMALGDANATDSLDPTTYVSRFPTFAAYLWGNALVGLDADMNLLPKLAESWDTSDAQTWAFKLRKGAEFHNGKSVTADDIVWSINRHRVEGAASGLGAIMGQIVEMKATGRDEVTFVLENPNADWPYALTDYHLRMQSEGDPVDKGIGTGGYIVESFDPGVRCLMKRNPNYWNSDAAHFDSIEIVGINDSSARVSALQTGAVHFIDDVPPKVAKLLERQFTINRVDSTQFGEFVVHTDTPPNDNNDVRLALKYAIDREEIVDKVMFGAATVGNDHPVPTSFRFYPSGLEQKAYDPDKAQFHYNKAGNPALPPLHVAGIAFNGAIEAAELFQQQARKAGITFDIQRAPDDGYWANTWDQKPFFASTWYGRATEDQILTQMLTSDSVYNEMNWYRSHIDKKLLEARKELDPAKRKQLYGDVLVELATEGGTCIPTFSQLLFGSAKNVGGFYVSPVGGDGSMVELLHFTS